MSIIRNLFNNWNLFKFLIRRRFGLWCWLWVWFRIISITSFVVIGFGFRSWCGCWGRSWGRIGNWFVIVIIFFIILILIIISIVIIISILYIILRLLILIILIIFYWILFINWFVLWDWWLLFLIFFLCCLWDFSILDFSWCLMFWI